MADDEQPNSVARVIESLKLIMPLLAIAMSLGIYVQLIRNLEKQNDEIVRRVDAVTQRLDSHERSDGHAGTRLRVEHMEDQLGEMRLEMRGLSHNMAVVCTELAPSGKCK